MLLLSEIYFDLENNIITNLDNIINISLDKLIKLLLKLGFWYIMNLIIMKYNKWFI